MVSFSDNQEMADLLHHNHSCGWNFQLWSLGHTLLCKFATYTCQAIKCHKKCATKSTKKDKRENFQIRQ